MPFTVSALNEMLDSQSITRSIALYDGDPAGAGTEITGTGYARINATMGAASGGARSNTNQVQWDNAGATDWNANTSHVALFDGVTMKGTAALTGGPYDMSIANATLTLAVGDIDETLS